MRAVRHSWYLLPTQVEGRFCLCMLRQPEGEATIHAELFSRCLVPVILPYHQTSAYLQLRVLATRASAGGFSLWQARGPDACLCIGSGDCEPAGSHSKLDIQPGFFKYGWYAEPQRFAVAMPQSTTTAAASAALKAMKGITMAPKPPDLRRHSSSSVADVSSQSAELTSRSSATRASSMKPSAPIAIGSFRDSSAEDSFGSSMYTDTILEGSGSVTSDTSMLTTKTNKTRRGKRGGKKQRESSQKFRMQSMPMSPSPMLVGISFVCLLPKHWSVCSSSPAAAAITAFLAQHSSHGLAQIARYFF